MGRGRARLAVALANAAQATSVYSSAAGKKDSFRVQVAEDVDLARVGFLKEAGRLQGEKFIAPERAKVFHDLAQIILPMSRCRRLASVRVTASVLRTSSSFWMPFCGRAWECW